MRIVGRLDRMAVALALVGVSATTAAAAPGEAPEEVAARDANDDFDGEPDLLDQMSSSREPTADTFGVRMFVDAELGVAGATDGPLMRAGATVRVQAAALVVGATLAAIGGVLSDSGWDSAALVGAAWSPANALRLEALAAIGYRELSVNKGGLVEDLEPSFSYGSPFVGLRLASDYVFAGATRRWLGFIGGVVYANFDLDRANAYTFSFDSCNLFGDDCHPMTRTGRHGGGYEIGFVWRIGFGVGM